MNKALYLLFPLAAALAVSCEEMNIDTPIAPETTISMKYNGQDLDESSVIPVYRNETAVVDFTATSVSKIVANAPQGWDAEVSMSSNTITISAPSVDDNSADTETDITLSLYDGSGKDPLSKAIKVKALYQSMAFAFVDEFDPATPATFSLGSQATFAYTSNASVKELSFELLKGWKAEDNGGSITITAPDLSKEEGDSEGVIVVTPVSWTGETLESISIAVKVLFESTFQFEDTEVTFEYGETKTLNVIVKGIKSIDTPVLPSAWTGDFSNIENGTITLTAPTTGASSSEFSISAIDFNNANIQSTSVVIRLFGINNIDEFLAFREAYGATSDTPNIAGHEKYMREGELCLNADINLSAETLEPTIKAYFIKHLNIPLNGCGYNLSVDYSVARAVGAIFQYIEGVKVHDLNLSGSITNSYSQVSSTSGFAATLKAGTVLSNIHNSVNVSYNAASGALASLVGGFACNTDDKGILTIENCIYDGTISINAPVQYAAAFLAKGGAGTGFLNKFDGCDFAGNLVYTQEVDNNQKTRLGGIVGDAARWVELTNCKFTGSMTFNLNNHTFIPNTNKLQIGIAGLVGRNTAQSGEYKMKLDIIDCVASGTITVNNAPSSDLKTITTIDEKQVGNNYGLVIGCIPTTKEETGAREVLTIINTTETGSITFN